MLLSEVLTDEAKERRINGQNALDAEVEYLQFVKHHRDYHWKFKDVHIKIRHSNRHLTVAECFIESNLHSSISPPYSRK